MNMHTFYIKDLTPLSNTRDVIFTSVTKQGCLSIILVFTMIANLQSI